MFPNATLRRERERHGWSQAYVARELGTDARSVGRWERGVTSPSPHFRTQLCHLFNLDAQALGLLPTSSSSLHTTVPLLDVDRLRLVLPAERVIVRQSLLDEIIAILTNMTTCILYGLPGVGKTTLAQLLASQLPHLSPHPFPDGIVWINLGPSPNIHHELLRIATMLNISEDKRGQPSDLPTLSHAIHQRLAEHHLLLILDDVWNIETLQPLLIGGPHVAHLLTTRLPELAFALPYAHPLNIPELTIEQSQTLLSYLVPQLASYHEDQDLLHSALQVTGGLPLSITLLGLFLRKQAIGGQRRRLLTALTQFSDAATRLSLPVPRNVIFRSADAPFSSSLQSLTTIIDVSNEYLPPHAHQALQALSVLPPKPASFSEAAALMVCEESITVLDQLLDAGLLEGAGEGRYRLHQSIHDYAHLHLHNKRPYQQLVGYALDFTQQHTNDHAVFLQELVVLEQAWEMARQHDWNDDLLNLTLHMDGFWSAQGHHHLALSRLQLAFDIAQKQQDALVICTILHTISSHHTVLGQVQQAIFFKQALLQQAQQHGLVLYQARALNGLGMLAGIQGQLLQAQTYYQQVSVIAHSLESPLPRLAAYQNLGRIAFEQGHFQQAEQLWQQGLALGEETNHKDWLCGYLYELASLYLYWSSHIDKATSYIQRAHPLAQALHDVYETVTVFIRQGQISCRLGNYDDAADCVRQAKEGVEQSDHIHLHYRICVEGARILLCIQQLSQAEQLLLALPTFPSSSSVSFDLKITAHLARGELCLAQTHAAEAYAHFQTAKTMCPQPYTFLRVQILYGLARAAAALGDTTQALEESHLCLQAMQDIEYWQVEEVKTWHNHLLTDATQQQCSE